MSTHLNPEQVNELADFMRQVSIRLAALESLANKHFHNELKDHIALAKETIPAVDAPDFMHAIRRASAAYR